MSWCDNGGEQRSPVSLGQPTLQLVTWRALARVMEQKAPRSVSWRLRACLGRGVAFQEKAGHVVNSCSVEDTVERVLAIVWPSTRGRLDTWYVQGGADNTVERSWRLLSML